MMRKAFMRPERIRNVGKRFLDVLAQHFMIGNVIRNFPHTVHVVGEGDQSCWLVGYFLESAPDPVRAGDFAKGPDMRQSGGAVTGLEENVRFGLASRFVALNTGQYFSGLFERPGLGGHGNVAIGKHSG